MKKQLLAFSFITTLTCAQAAFGQSPLDPVVATAASFDAAARQSVIETLSTVLIDNYIFPDIGDRAAGLVQTNLKSGRYDGLDRKAFADRLTEDLRSVTHDLHMRVTLEGPPQATPSSGSESAVPQGMFQIKRADRLKGNVGYVRIDGFLPPEMFRIGADAVMQKLAGTDALIIDMRENHGGHPGGVSYLVSFFVDPANPVHVNDLIWREPGTDQYRREVFSTSPTPVSYLDKPVFILTGAGTFSGGEEFSYDMQQLKRARLIGEATGGGANPGRTWPVGSGLIIFVPTGRAENPLTKTNWEGSGVKPDVAVPADAAFGKAYALALAATGKPAVEDTAGTTPDTVLRERLLVRRTDPYPGGAELVRASVEGLANGEQPFHLFSLGLAEALRGPVPADLQAMVAKLGPIQSIRFRGVDALGGDEYEVNFANGRQIWNIVVDKDGKLVSSSFDNG